MNKKFLKSKIIRNLKNKFFNTLLLRLWGHLRTKRKIQIYGLTFLIINLGLSEILTLFSFQEFLAFLANPNQIEKYQLTNNFLKILNVNNINNFIVPSTALLIFLVTSTIVIRLSTLRFIEKISSLVGNDLSTKALKNIIFQPYKDHLSQNSSEIITAVVVYVDSAVKTLRLVTIGFSALIVSLSIILGLLKIEKNLALISLIISIICYLFIGKSTRKILLENSSQKAKGQVNQVKIISEVIGAIKDVILMQSYDFYLKRFKKEDFKVRKSMASTAFISVMPRYIIESAAIIFLALIVLLFYTNNYSPEYILPTLGSFAIGSQKLLPALQNCFLSWSGLKSQRTALTKLLYYLDLNNKEYIELKNKKSLHFEELFQIKDVSFAYDKNSSSTLSDINISIKKGEKIGFFGSTGSGKSSLIDIINGLLKPISGYLILDGQNLHDPNNSSLLKSWQTSLAYVPQTIFLSDSTIMENIAFGIDKSQINMEKVIEASKKAYILKYINSLPNKFNTIVGERGIRLSGGQRQRISLARAIYRLLNNTNILILDESTSALDIATEKKVIDSLININNDLTIIMITHRLTTLTKFDRVIELKNGKVLRFGKPEDILNL